MDAERTGTIHASCVARDGAGVLILGPSGSGKSDLALRLLDRGFALVADDRVRLADGIAASPEALRGLIEVRGVGIVEVEPGPATPIALVVQLAEAEPRLPPVRTDPVLGVPFVILCASHPSAALKVEIALDCTRGGKRLRAGFRA